MPMVYEDSADAREIVGFGWTKPYAEAMGDHRPAHRKGWRRRRHPLRSLREGEDMVLEMEARRLPGFAGLGDVTGDFNRWSSILDQYNGYAVRIDKAAVRATLASIYRRLASRRDSLKSKLAGGAPGARDVSDMATFNKETKAFRDAVNKGRNTYGLLPPGAPPTAEEKKKKEEGGLPILPIAIVLGLIAAFG